MDLKELNLSENCQRFINSKLIQGKVLVKNLACECQPSGWNGLKGI